MANARWTDSMPATEALFTLNTSLEHSKDAGLANDARVGANRARIGGGNPSAVTGVCFVRDPTCHADSNARSYSEAGIGSTRDGSDYDSDDDSDDGRALQFRCSDVLLGRQCGNGETDATKLSAASHNSLLGAVLGSCHLDGSCKLWDLATRRCIVKDICEANPRGGSGLALRRLGDGGGDAAYQFLYQTRDPFGTVTLHHLERPCTSITQIHTYSSTFCAMSPCHVVGADGIGSMGGERNLVALPAEEHSVAVVRDLRCDARGNPAWKVAIGEEYINSMYGTRRKYGMLTSLALCLQETTQRIVLGCGMENGSALFYDLGMIERGRDPWWIDPSCGNDVEDVCGNGDSSFATMSANDEFMCSATLGKDPVLCLDLVSSYLQSSSEESNANHGIEHDLEGRASLVAVGGCAGDADELADLPENEQGTVTTMKVKLAADSSAGCPSSSAMSAKIRARTRTCSVESGGKVGVSICRFRPDGRVFATGGWDRRLRIFGRSSSKPLAVLRGHDGSVTAVDWASNSAYSGLLATGSDDGRVCVWRTFPHSQRRHAWSEDGQYPHFDT